jgi:polysaccharide biosynthesis protein PslG
MRRASFPALRVALLLTLMVGLFACLPRQAAAAQPPAFFVGIQNWNDPTLHQLARIQEAEVASWRLNLNWSSVERAPARYTWKRYDPVFLNAARADVRVLPVLLASPGWVCNPTCSAHRPHYPPKTAAHRKRFYEFAFQVARRYGPDGRFWTGTGVPRSMRPSWFQVWNEPNLPNYWNGAPDAEGYGRFLRKTGIALERGDPEARVLAAGLPDSSSRSDIIQMPTFIRRMLAVPGVPDVVDGVAVHPYSKHVGDIFARLDSARRAMRASLGGSTKPLFITEFGWATGGRSGLSTTRATQADKLREAYRQLLDRRERYRLLGAYWFTFRDRRPKPWLIDWWGWYSGLFDRYGRPKPAWREFRLVGKGQLP